MDVRSRHHFQQAWLKTPSCLTIWGSGSLLGLTDTASAFPHAVHPVGKLSICPRKTHTEDTDTTSYTESVLPSTVPTYRIGISPESPICSFSWAGRDRRSSMQEHI